MRSVTGKFTFTVPEDAILREAGADGVFTDSPHPDAGTKLKDQPFDYEQVESEDEARQVMESKKWTIIDFVNEALKTNARANRYQNMLVQYKPSDVSADTIRQRTIRDLLKLYPNLTEEQATAIVTSAGAQG